MGDALLDVGVITLAHADPETPGHEVALEHVRRAIRGERDTVVPYPAVVGAHHVLREAYRIPRPEATYRLTGFVEATRPRWYDAVSEADVRGALALSGDHNVDSWDGYYAHVARETGATTVLTLDDDFDRIDGLTAEIVLTDEEFARLNDFLAELEE